MNRHNLLFIRIGDYLVHSGRLCLLGSIANTHNTNRTLFGTKSDRNKISDLDGIRSLGYLSVYSYARGIASIVCDGPALDQSRNLQILIQSHY